MSRKILIAGETGNHCLEMSYYNAFREAGFDVKLYDTKKAVRNFARAGKLGYSIHRFWPVDAWVRKANKEFAELVRDFEPEILIAFTGAEILPGCFAYIKSILPVKIVWYWADPLPNLSRYLQSSLSVTDLVATYSQSSEDVFSLMGAKSTCWLPFAADTNAHFELVKETPNYNYDISFVGSWRPEREFVLKTIYEGFPHLRYKVNGPYWNRASFEPIRKIADTRPLYGKEFSSVVQGSLINLNIMDNTNYPSVNMRFFEILAAGGLELCSNAPEMLDSFKHEKHVLYFKNKEELLSIVQRILQQNIDTYQISRAGQEMVLANHLYSHRIDELLRNI